MHRLALGTLLLGLLVAPAAAEGPSFDCAKAALPVEKAICANPALAALDARMTRAYRQAVQRLMRDPATLAALRADQRLFLMTRDDMFEHPDYDLTTHLTDRVSLLSSILAEKPKMFQSSWMSAAGLVDITSSRDGRLRVFATSSDGSIGRWTCEFIGYGAPKGSSLVVAGEPGDGDYDGWRLAITRKGWHIVVEELPPAQSNGNNSVKPFCGAAGTLAGAYFGVTGEGNGDEKGSVE